MLTEKDVDWIRSNRKEITKNRTSSITLIGKKEEEKDPVTGEPIEKDVEKDTKAIVIEMTSAFKFDISLKEGAETEEGDLWVVVDRDDMKLDSEDVSEIKYREEKYKVLAADTLGLGKLNRTIFVGRKVV